MKKIYTLCLAVGLTCSLNAQTIWNGPTITYTKANFVDVTLEENQDRITDDVWITRGNSQGIFNAASEDSYIFSSPEGTEWALGTTAEIESLSFNNWDDAISSNPIDNMVNQDMVMRIVASDIYIDVKFTSWQQGLGQGQPGGGGFTYERSTEGTTGTADLETVALSIYPNPAAEFVVIDGISEAVNFTIIDQLSREVLRGQASPKSRIDLNGLQNGMYFIRLEGSAELIRFQKN